MPTLTEIQPEDAAILRAASRRHAAERQARLDQEMAEKAARAAQRRELRTRLDPDWEAWSAFEKSIRRLNQRLDREAPAMASASSCLSDHYKLAMKAVEKAPARAMLTGFRLVQERVKTFRRNDWESFVTSLSRRLAFMDTWDRILNSDKYDTSESQTLRVCRDVSPQCGSGDGRIVRKRIGSR